VHHYDVCTPPSDTPTYLDTRVVKNDFNTQLFDYIPQSPHIIFDFAHNVHYTENGNTIEETPKNVKAIYGGYLGDKLWVDLELWTNFTVDESGNVTTFIDKMIEKQIGFHPSNPLGYFEDDVLPSLKQKMIQEKVLEDFTQEQRNKMFEYIDLQFENYDFKLGKIKEVLSTL
jgi:hypothetical protein